MNGKFTRLTKALIELESAEREVASALLELGYPTYKEEEPKAVSQEPVPKPRAIGGKLLLPCSNTVPTRGDNIRWEGQNETYKVIDQSPIILACGAAQLTFEEALEKFGTGYKIFKPVLKPKPKTDEDD